MAHFEGESCSIFQFRQVQEQAKNGIHNNLMVERMLK